MHDDTAVHLLDRQVAVPALGRRLSWGAIIAGVVIALSIQLLLNLLGVGIGASTISPTQGDNPGTGLAIGAAVWFVVSALISCSSVDGRQVGLQVPPSIRMECFKALPPGVLQRSRL